MAEIKKDEIKKSSANKKMTKSTQGKTTKKSSAVSKSAGTKKSKVQKEQDLEIKNQVEPAINNYVEPKIQIDDKQPNKNMNYSYMNKQDTKGITIATLSYLLFFLPFIFCPDNKYARFHANQGLVLLIFSAVSILIFAFIPVVGKYFTIFFALISFILLIIGITNALGGRAKRLPVIGEIKLIELKDE